MTFFDHWDTISAWCTLSALDASTPKGSSRTSQPWQNGQCSTSLPKRSATPGTSGSSSFSPVATISRRARTVPPDSRATVKPAAASSPRVTSVTRSRTRPTP